MPRVVRSRYRHARRAYGIWSPPSIVSPVPEQVSYAGRWAGLFMGEAAGQWIFKWVVGAAGLLLLGGLSLVGFVVKSLQ